MRTVFNIAAKYNLDPLLLTQALKDAGLNIRNHMSMVSDEDMDRYIEMVLKEKIDISYIEKEEEPNIEDLSEDEDSCYDYNEDYYDDHDENECSYCGCPMQSFQEECYNCESKY